MMILHAFFRTGLGLYNPVTVDHGNFSGAHAICLQYNNISVGHHSCFSRHPMWQIIYFMRQVIFNV